jgi:hypothetical protein
MLVMLKLCSLKFSGQNYLKKSVSFSQHFILIIEFIIQFIDLNGISEMLSLLNERHIVHCSTAIQGTLQFIKKRDQISGSV